MARKDIFSETIDSGCLAGLTETDYRYCVEHLDVVMESRTRECPFCGSAEIIRKGYSSNGTQRYGCKACGRGFIGNVFPYTHVPLDKWKAFSRAYLEGTPLIRCAAACGVCLKTAQYMKHRLVDMVRNDPSIPLTFCGEMLVDA